MTNIIGAFNAPIMFVIQSHTFLVTFLGGVTEYFRGKSGALKRSFFKSFFLMLKSHGKQIKSIMYKGLL